MKTAAGYVRVSTPGQAKDQKTSPENQEQEIHDYAKKHELKVVDVYRDLGVSGKTSERPALQQLLMNAKSGRFEVAVVHRLSRFGRNARDLLNNVSVLQEAGVQFRSIKEGIDFSSVYGKTVLTILAAVAELEREIILEQTLENKIRKVISGIPVGPKPFGRLYDKEKKTWSLDEKKAKLIRKAKKEFLSGVSFTKVAQKAGMSIQRLHYIFKNSCGNKWEMKFKGLDEPIVFDVPELLTPSEIARIHKQFQLTKEVFHGQCVYQYLLSRMVFCGHCGTALYGMTDKKHGYRYYIHQRKENKNCPDGSFRVIQAAPLEDSVKKAVFEIYGDDEAREKALKAADTGAGYTQKLEGKVKAVEKTLKKIVNEKKNLVHAVAKGRLPKGEIKNLMDGLLRDEAEAKNEIEKLKFELQKRVTSQDMQEMLDWDYLGTEEHLAEMSFEEVHRLMQTVFAERDKGYGVFVKKSKKTGKYIYRVKGKFLPFIRGEIDVKQDKKDQRAFRQRAGGR